MKPYNTIIMNRLLITLFLWLAVSLPGYTQSGLEINRIFNGRYVDDPKVSETMISGKNKFLQSHRLTVFASFKGPAVVYRQEAEHLVLSDGAKAIGKNVRYREGKLYFALFNLKPVNVNGKKLNRYIYYLNNAVGGGGNVLILYLEGTLSEQDAADLIQSLAKKAK